jgi:protein AroM
MTVGTVTIGQSPRVDIIPEIRDVLGMDVEIIEKGALDGLTIDEVNKFLPRPGEDFLVTRMNDGTEVKIAEAHLITRISRCITEFQKEPAEIILFLCTGKFPEFECRKMLLRPDRIMYRLVQGLVTKGRLGVVVPEPDQIPAMKVKWQNPQLEIVAEAFSPYTGIPEEMENVADRIRTADVDLVVLDCMGFNCEAMARFRKITGRPVILPRRVIAAVARELIT